MSIERERPAKRECTIGGKKILIYPSAAAGKPIVYLHAFAEEGDRVYEALRRGNCPDCTLVAIGGLHWNHDMAPWDIPSIAPGDTPCTGGAPAYLRRFADEIVPEAEQWIKGPVLWRGIAGYSLAGLFAVYSMYQTELFSRIASISGSLWFPGFAAYVFSQEMKRRPERLYFSLGDKECRTQNPHLKTVQAQTEKIERFYKDAGVDTILQYNPGGHFKNAVQRTAAGIAWLLTR